MGKEILKKVAVRFDAFILLLVLTVVVGYIPHCRCCMTQVRVNPETCHWCCPVQPTPQPFHKQKLLCLSCQTFKDLSVIVVSAPSCTHEKDKCKMLKCFESHGSNNAPIQITPNSYPGKMYGALFCAWEWWGSETGSGMKWRLRCGRTPEEL